VPRFRKRPLIVEAVQFTGQNCYQILQFVGRERELQSGICEISPTDQPVIPNPRGDMVASPGDWVIKGVAGEFCACKPEIFAASYTPISSMNHGERVFQKRPVTITAEQYGGPPTVAGLDTLTPPVPAGVEWVPFHGVPDRYPAIATLEGVMQVSPGDWVITGVAGERYPCPDPMFQTVYEPIPD
jgi:hypothetical protein